MTLIYTQYNWFIHISLALTTVFNWMHVSWSHIPTITVRSALWTQFALTIRRPRVTTGADLRPLNKILILSSSLASTRSQAFLIMTLSVQPQQHAPENEWCFVPLGASFISIVSVGRHARACQACVVCKTLLNENADTASASVWDCILQPAAMWIHLLLPFRLPFVPVGPRHDKAKPHVVEMCGDKLSTSHTCMVVRSPHNLTTRRSGQAW